MQIAVTDLRQNGGLGVLRRSCSIFGSSLYAAIRLAIFSAIVAVIFALALVAYRPGISPDEAAATIGIPFMFLALCVRVARTRWAPLRPAELLHRQRLSITGIVVTAWIFDATVLLVLTLSAVSYWGLGLFWAYHLALKLVVALAILFAAGGGAVALLFFRDDSRGRDRFFGAVLIQSIRVLLGLPESARYVVRHNIFAIGSAS